MDSWRLTAALLILPAAALAAVSTGAAVALWAVRSRKDPRAPQSRAA